MKPYPLSALNHFTVPCTIATPVARSRTLGSDPLVLLARLTGIRRGTGVAICTEDPISRRPICHDPPGRDPRDETNALAMTIRDAEISDCHDSRETLGRAANSR